MLNFDAALTMRFINSELAFDAVSVTLTLKNVGVPLVFHVCVRLTNDWAFAPVSDGDVAMPITVVLSAGRNVIDLCAPSVLRPSFHTWSIAMRSRTSSLN